MCALFYNLPHLRENEVHPLVTHNARQDEMSAASKAAQGIDASDMFGDVHVAPLSSIPQNGLDAH